VFSATRLLAVHPCSFGSCERPLPSDTAHILPLLGPAPPALEAVKRVTSWRGFIPLCVMPYETGVNVLGCNSKRQHFVTGRVSPRPLSLLGPWLNLPATVDSRRRSDAYRPPAFCHKRDGLAARKPTHISHPQSYSWATAGGGRGRIATGGTESARPLLTNYRFLGIDEVVFGSSASANFREA